MESANSDSIIVRPPRARRGRAIAVWCPQKATALREKLGACAADVEMLDIAELGRNPARIIPAVGAMLARHRGQRSLRRRTRVARALAGGDPGGDAPRGMQSDLAWPQTPIRVLCAYDSAALPEHVLADAEGSRPHVIHGARPAHPEPGVRLGPEGAARL